MLNAVLEYLHNDFRMSVHEDTYAIDGGAIALPFLQAGQYFRIVGSVFNDGVYQYPAYDLADEEFEGAVIAMAVPADLIKTVAEITEWDSKNGSSDYVSESFGGYSYTKATGTKGGVMTWHDKFAQRLRRWKKI